MKGASIQSSLDTLFVKIYILEAADADGRIGRARDDGVHLRVPRDCPHCAAVPPHNLGLCNGEDIEYNNLVR